MMVIFNVMPRLSARQYLKAHDRLRQLWVRDPSLFAELNPAEQWLLHDFFKPDKDWTDLELLQHRDKVTAERPSLPHQAGRTLNKFWETTPRVGVRRVARAKAAAPPAKRVRQADRHLVVKSLVKPEIDVKKLARAYAWLLQEKLKERQQETQADEDVAA